MPTEELSTEQIEIRGWRRRCLLEFPDVTLLDARLLSESNGDLHLMVQLLEAGATGEQVRRIVL